jgi:hypothetical protein
MVLAIVPNPSPERDLGHTLGIHYESQVLDGSLSKEGLIFLHLQLMLMQQFKHSVHMLQMVLPRVTEDQNIIQINNDKLTQVWSEDVINECT